MDTIRMKVAVAAGPAEVHVPMDTSHHAATADLEMGGDVANSAPPPPPATAAATARRAAAVDARAAADARFTPCASKHADGVRIEIAARCCATSAAATDELDAHTVVLRPRAPTADDSVCYICMDDDEATNDLGAPLRRVCACTSAAIHASCLEKLLNSKKSRAMALPERTLCSVCNSAYTLTLQPFVLHSVMLPTSVEYLIRTPGGKLASRLLLLLISALHVTAFVFLLTKASILISLSYLFLATVPMLVLHRMRELRRRRITDMDDLQFHAEAVVYARRELRLGRGPTVEHACTVPSQMLILLVPAAGRLAATAARPCEDEEGPNGCYGHRGVCERLRCSACAAAVAGARALCAPPRRRGYWVQEAPAPAPAPTAESLVTLPRPPRLLQQAARVPGVDDVSMAAIDTPAREFR